MLVVIYSVLLLSLLGAGALLCRLLQRGRPRRLFISMAAGVSCLHALTLLGLPMVLILGALGVAAAVEGLLLWRVRRWPPRGSAPSWRWLALIIASALPLWGYTMFRPLWAFDARNVWFFAGRIIFTTGHFRAEAFHRLICHWGPDYRLNMNADYPKLIGSLTAAVATLAGYWNEYLPKIGILLLHTLWLFGLAELGWRWRAVGVNLLVSGVSQYRYFFDSASLDIHVAALTLVSLLSLVRSAEPSSKETQDQPGVDVDMALAALAVASQLKYEGRALTAIVLVAALLSGIATLRSLRRAAPLFLLFTPTVLWLAEVRLFGVPSYLQYSAGVSVALARLRTDLFSHILPGIVSQRATLVGLVSFVLAVVVARRADSSVSLGALARAPHVRLGVLTALAYTAALTGVYLVTPYTVTEQMQTSVERATLPIEAALLASAIAIVDGLASRLRRST